MVNPDSTVTLHNLVTGAMRGDRTLIREGLKPGDKVVTQGVDRLRDGAKVDVIPPRGASPPVTDASQKKAGPGGDKQGKGPPIP